MQKEEKNIVKKYWVPWRRSSVLLSSCHALDLLELLILHKCYMKVLCM